MKAAMRIMWPTNINLQKASEANGFAKLLEKNKSTPAS
jgi:hypothetical protein